MCGFSIIARGFDPADAIGAGLLRALAVVRSSYISLGKAGRGGCVEDMDGRPEKVLEDHNWAAVNVRPDFYVYGGATDETAFGSLVRDLLSDLKGAGVKMPSESRRQAREANVEAYKICDWG